MPAQDIRSYSIGRFSDPGKVARAMRDPDLNARDLAAGCLAAAAYGNFANLGAWISASGGAGAFSMRIAQSLETAASRGRDIVPVVRDLFSGLEPEARGQALSQVTHHAAHHKMPGAFAAALAVLGEDRDAGKAYLSALRAATRLISRDSPDTAGQVEILRTLHRAKIDVEDVGMASGNAELMHLGVRFRMEDAEAEAARLRKQFEAAAAENEKLRATIADQPRQADLARSRRYNMT